MEKTWEKKTITYLEILNMGTNSSGAAIEKYRDWLLGGALMEWRYSKDRDYNLILERR